MDDQGSQKARRGTLRAVAASGSLTKHSSSKILDSAPFNDKKRPAPVEGGRSTKNDGEQESDEDDRAASESTAVAQQGRSKRPRVHVEGDDGGGASKAKANTGKTKRPMSPVQDHADYYEPDDFRNFGTEGTRDGGHDDGAEDYYGDLDDNEFQVTAGHGQDEVEKEIEAPLGTHAYTGNYQLLPMRRYNVTINFNSLQAYRTEVWILQHALPGLQTSPLHRQGTAVSLFLRDVLEKLPALRARLHVLEQDASWFRGKMNELRVAACQAAAAKLRNFPLAPNVVFEQQAAHELHLMWICNALEPGRYGRIFRRNTSKEEYEEMMQIIRDLMAKHSSLYDSGILPGLADLERGTPHSSVSHETAGQPLLLSQHPTWLLVNGLLGNHVRTNTDKHLLDYPIIRVNKMGVAEVLWHDPTYLLVSKIKAAFAEHEHLLAKQAKEAENNFFYLDEDNESLEYAEAKQETLAELKLVVLGLLGPGVAQCSGLARQVKAYGRQLSQIRAYVDKLECESMYGTPSTTSDLHGAVRGKFAVMEVIMPIMVALVAEDRASKAEENAEATHAMLVEALPQLL